MKIIDPSYTILSPATPEGRYDPSGVLQLIERAGRVCYKSEDRITGTSASKFVRMIRDRNHASVLEHSMLSVLFVTDRGVSHELVRHRLASFSQESTRYCNYNGGVTFIRPPFWGSGTNGYVLWLEAMMLAEDTYLKLLSSGAKPEEARSVLPNSVKTEIVVTANLREWRHIFSLRTAKAAHPQMRQVMCPLFAEMCDALPEVFG